MESPNTSGDKNDALISVYEEICNSYHALDDFRMKLLGLLPLTSLVGIFLLNSDNLFTKSNIISNELIGFIGFFAATFTLALFLYEIRGILRCHGLINRGSAIEQMLGVQGQFSVCKKEDERAKKSKKHKENIFNAKLAACVIYSLVFAAWLFMALRYGMGQSIYGCALTALVMGLIIALSAYALVNKMVAA